ncbi:MAG: division/cell wall cluster transcriptional repressor MraZ [Coriobacteriia bacterium]|nr:division/cell wall cluster transcriptional repressor MraZ [Coriobacteriia bacterium]
MFLGDYQHTMDAKGRVSLPSKFRAQLTGKLVVAKGFEGCLAVYSTDEYDRYVGALMAKQDFDEEVRRLRRKLTSGAQEVELDSAGRISLTQQLRDYAGLKKDVAVTGNGNRIEIWDSERWATYIGDDGGSIEDLASKLATAGLL